MEHKKILGTEFKVMINIQPVLGFDLMNQNFELVFYTQTHKEVLLKKNDPFVKILEDGNGCIACITTDNALKIGKGAVKLKFIAHVQDFDFPDNVRTEIYGGIYTGVTIV